MSADEHLNQGQAKPSPYQMKLFVDPEEHINSLVGSVDLYGGDTWSSLWNYKEEEAREPDYGHGAGVYDSIKEKGFNWERESAGRGSPSQIRYAPTAFPASEGSRQEGWVQGEGHHRIAAAAALQRETGQHVWVPINYDNWSFPANRKISDRSLHYPRSSSEETW